MSEEGLIGGRHTTQAPQTIESDTTHITRPWCTTTPRCHDGDEHTHVRRDLLPISRNCVGVGEEQRVEPTSLRRRVSCSSKPQTQPRATRALCVCSAKIALRAFLKPAPSVLQQRLCTHRDNPHNEIDLGRICPPTLTHTHTHTHTHTPPLSLSLCRSLRVRRPRTHSQRGRTSPLVSSARVSLCALRRPRRKTRLGCCV